MSSTVPNPASPATSPAGWSGPLVALGILSVVLGVIVLVWPEATLLVVAIIFGLQLIAAGAVRLSVSRDLPSDPGWLKPVSMGLGVLSIVAGVICLFRPNASLFVIAIFIAIGWIAEGIAALAQGFGSDRTTGTRVFLIVCGVVSILAGLVVAIFPGSSLVLLARLARHRAHPHRHRRARRGLHGPSRRRHGKHGQPAGTRRGLTAYDRVEVRTPGRGREPPRRVGRLRSGLRRQVLELEDAADLDRHLLEERHEPLSELEGLLLALDLDDGETADDLTGLGERPVGHGDAAALGLAQDGAVLALGDALGGEQHARTRRTPA